MDLIFLLDHIFSFYFLQRTRIIIVIEFLKFHIKYIGGFYFQNFITETRGKRDREKDTRDEREYEQDQSSSRDHREDREPRDVRDRRDARDTRDRRELRDSRDIRDSREMRDYSRDNKESRDPRDSRSTRDAHDYRDRESRDAHRKEDTYPEESRSYGRNHLREESSRTELRNDSRSESRGEIRNDRMGRSRGRGPELPEKGKVFDLSVNCILYIYIEIIKSPKISFVNILFLHLK